MNGSTAHFPPQDSACFGSLASNVHHQVCGTGVGTACRRLQCLLCTQVGPGRRCQPTNATAPPHGPPPPTPPHIIAVPLPPQCQRLSGLYTFTNDLRGAGWCRKVEPLLWVEQPWLFDAAATVGGSLACLELRRATERMPYRLKRLSMGISLSCHVLHGIIFMTMRPVCREVERLPWAEEVLVTKSELEEKKQRTAELETQVRQAPEPSLLSGEQPIWQAQTASYVCQNWVNPRAVLTWRGLLWAMPAASMHTSCLYSVSSVCCWVALRTDQTVHASDVYVFTALDMHQHCCAICYCLKGLQTRHCPRRLPCRSMRPL